MSATAATKGPGRRPGPAGRLALLAAAALSAASPAAAQAAPAPSPAYENELRLKGGGYFPQDLPTEQGLFWGIEGRSLLTRRDGVEYGIGRFYERRTQSFQSGGQRGTFEAKFLIVPITVGWFRRWPSNRMAFTFGVGGGFYVVDAFSGGFNSQVQIKNASEFRFVEDGTRFGIHLLGGADFFPGKRWGLGLEARIHIVEDSLDALEASASSVLRF